MADASQLVDRPDPIIEYYKQFVDRQALRENLKLTPDERLRKLTEKMRGTEARGKAGRSLVDLQFPTPRWDAISDTSLKRTSDPVIELYKRDVDRTLLRENLKLTPEQRLLKLTDFMRFAEMLREAGRRQRETT